MTAIEIMNPNRIFTQANWDKCNRDISAKILSECMYEELLAPDFIDKETINGQDYHRYRQAFSNGDTYEFTAKKRKYFGFMRVMPCSLKRLEEGKPVDLDDAYRLILNLNQAIGVKDHTAAYAIREFSNTLTGDMHQLAGERLTNDALLATDEITIESQLIAHPWIIANKGRLGFSYHDYLQHAPEMANQSPLLWIAVNKNKAEYNAISQLDYDKLLIEELDEACLERFSGVLSALGLSHRNFYYMPVHSWQWSNEIVSLFARELVAQDIVLLGHSHDDYQPQQSIRTFSNRTNPSRRYVKLPISILNTSVYRGLPPERVKIAPTLSQWLLDEVEQDPFLKNETGLILLGEVATLNYDHPIYGQMNNIPYQFREKLAVVWRESIHTKMSPNERCIPLAALMHIDVNGEPLLGAIIENSELSTDEWIGQFLKVTIEPLVHVLYKFGFVFSPHGQNALLVLENNQPTRLAVKDFVDDANICADPIPEQSSLPDALEDILECLEGPILIQWIQSGLFVCVFRYLTEILEDYLDYSEEAFWIQVLDVLTAYHAKFPELQDRFDAFDLLRPVFPKLCLNRVRLLDKGYSDDVERPSAAITSMLDNPLALVTNKQSITE